jgi:hypothetical protein
MSMDSFDTYPSFSKRGSKKWFLRRNLDPVRGCIHAFCNAQQRDDLIFNLRQLHGNHIIHVCHDIEVLVVIRTGIARVVVIVCAGGEWYG